VAVGRELDGVAACEDRDAVADIGGGELSPSCGVFGGRHPGL